MNRLSRQLCQVVIDHLTGKQKRPPVAGLLIWNAFLSLSRTRTYNMKGPNPIQPSEIEAFCRIMAVPLAQRHISILQAMDDAWLGHQYSQSKAPSQSTKSLATVSSQPLSPALWDAIVG